MPDHEHKYLKITVEKADGMTLVFDLTDPDSEPVFLLRGQDEFAHRAVRAYSLVLQNAGLVDQADHALEHAEAMLKWPVKKTPD